MLTVDDEIWIPLYGQVYWVGPVKEIRNRKTGQVTCKQEVHMGLTDFKHLDFDWTMEMWPCHFKNNEFLELYRNDIIWCEFCLFPEGPKHIRNVRFPDDANNN